jgi:hypothetical protein
VPRSAQPCLSVVERAWPRGAWSRLDRLLPLAGRALTAAVLTDGRTITFGDGSNAELNLHGEQTARH